MSNKPEKRKAFAVNAIVFGFSAGIIIFLMLYITDSLVYTEPKNFEFDSHEPYNQSQAYSGTLLLTSKSFSEYSTIDVSMTVTVTNGIQYPELFAIFPSSYNVPHDPTGFGTGIGAGWVQLTMKSPNHYEGSGKIEYQIADEYWFGITRTLPDVLTGPDSEIAENRIIIREKGWGFPTLTDKILVSGTILPITAGIILGRARLLKFFLESENNENNESTKRDDRNNNSKPAKGKKGRR